jgi:hypothetical protein
MTEPTCDFTGLHEAEVNQMKQYLNILLENGLITRETTIGDLLRLIHPDKVSSVIPDEINRNCANQLFVGYYKYLNSASIENKTVGYILDLQIDGRAEEEPINLIETLFALTACDPILQSKNMREQTLMLCEAIFHIERTEDPSVPYKISEKFTNINDDESMMCLSDKIKQFECDVDHFTSIQYLLCFSALLEEYGKSLVTNSGGKNIKKNKNKNKKGTIKKRPNNRGKRNKKTHRKKYGGQPDPDEEEAVKNLARPRNFYSWLLYSDIGTFVDLPRDVQFQHITDEDIKEYTSEVADDEKRDEFYALYDEWEQQVRDKLEEIEVKACVKAAGGAAMGGGGGGITLMGRLPKPITDTELKKAGVLDWREDPRFKTASVYLQNVREIWLKLRPLVDKIRESDKELIRRTTDKAIPNKINLEEQIDLSQLLPAER